MSLLLAGAGGAAAAANQLSKLPTQQQLLLYCLCVLCPGASSGASTTQADLCRLWGLPPPAGADGSGEDTPVKHCSSSSSTPGGRPAGSSSFTPLTGSRGGGGGKGSSCRKRGRMERAGGSSSSVGLSTASVDAIWQLNLKVAKTVGVSPLSPEEVSNQLELMAQMALVDLVPPSAGPGCSPAPGFAAAGGGRKLLKPQRLFLAAAGRKGGSSAAAAAADAGSGGARAGLRVAYETVLRSFKTHPLFRKLLGTESA
jgi:hypothetical protein